MKEGNPSALNEIWEGIPADWIETKPTDKGVSAEWAGGRAREQLVGTLQSAYSGELGAILAYRGHKRSVRDPEEQDMIHRIELEEIAHRERVGEMLHQMGETPISKIDRIMNLIGNTLGFLCHWSGWFAPMYGAGLLESRNIREYEEAALYTVRSGHPEFLDDLLTMAEVEWEHEEFFREKCQSHFLHRWFPKWEIPPPKHKIREPFDGVTYPEGRLRHSIF